MSSRISSFPAGIAGVLAGLSTAALWIASLPPFDLAEGAYIALLPLLLWCYTRPAGRVFWPVAIGTGWLAWAGILVWLRHVTVAGTVVLALALGLFFALWLAAARWLLPLAVTCALPVRLGVLGGLAGFWVVLEWVRTWFLWGFPWAPFALSQWQRPVVLQVAAYTGAWGVSLLLVLFNLCVAHALRLRFARRSSRMWSGWFSPELYLAIGLLAATVGFFFRTLPPPDSRVPLLSVGAVQPYITPDLKWDTERERENLRTLFEQTRFVGAFDADVVLWPEASTPWPVVGNPEMAVLATRLSTEIGQPILMGNLAWSEDPDGGERWENVVAVVYPDSGLDPDHYIKRKLVPFGEYVPFRELLGFIEKVVPVGGDFRPGAVPALIELRLGGDEPRTVRVGSLICYEDIFPHLARRSVAAGADLLFVTTNNAWYGEEGGAYQHAAHSVLRAVENRRPVVRCGNGGWSGWIDCYGGIREVVSDENGSVYFRGGGRMDLFTFDNWTGQRSFYTRHGDWFIAAAAAMAAAAATIGRMKSGRR